MQHSKKVKLVKHYFDQTQLTLHQIGEETGLGYKFVWVTVEREYTKEQRAARKKENYSRSKKGSKNPMQGKCLSEHHNWIGGRVSDGRGYIMINKPEWYTGRKGSKYVFEHTAVVCAALGLTELPAGWSIHHIDGDKTNNEVDNLALLTLGGHARLHHLERVTTRRKP